MAHDLVMEPTRTKARTWTIDSASVTRQGSHRTVNEDALFERVGRANAAQSVGLFVLCDGLGGLTGGDVASQLAVKTVTAALSGMFGPRASPEPTSAFLRQFIRGAVSRANAEIRNCARARGIQAGRLGTTITLALIGGRTAYIANVGDSRAYAWRNGSMKQITEDHSMAMTLIRVGMMTEAEALSDPRRNVLLRALGRDDEVEADLFEWPLEPGDRLLLCSDGLWAAFPDESDLEDMLGAHLPPAAICRQLAAEANRRNGSDDVSAIVVSLL